VLNERARYEMLAGRVDSAVELGLEAMWMAEELGLDDQRLRALSTVGVAHGDMGDPAGIAEMEEVIRLASQVNAISELVRAWNNLTALYILHGNLEQTQAGEVETLRLARHFGHHGYVRFIEGGAAVGNRFHAGEWDDALARAEKVIAELERGVGIYGGGAVLVFRGLIRLARGEDGAESDAERAVEHARRIGDVQAVNPRLALAAFIFTSVGNKQRADETVTEALESIRDIHCLGFGVMEVPFLAWAALALGREAEVAERLERESFKSVWQRAGLAVTARDFRSAADLMGGAGLKSYEAFFRLQTGLEEDVRAALDFYRGVGATRYIGEAEGLLAVKA
jgi:hypothetical protein